MTALTPDFSNDFDIGPRELEGTHLVAGVFSDWDTDQQILRWGDEGVMVSFVIQDRLTHEVTHAAMSTDHILERLAKLQAKREEYDKEALSADACNRVVTWFHEVEEQLKMTVVVRPDVKVVVL